MKTSKKLISVLMVTAVAASAFALASCDNTKEPDPDKSETVLEFVAADKTNWDKEVTLGKKTYQMSLKLNSDKTLDLVATCTGESAGGGNPGGPGGGGSGDSGAPASYIVREDAEGEGADETPGEGEIVDYTPYNFTIDGSWSEEKGWGYTLTFNDTAKTVIVADFDATMGRHYFYYYMSPVVAGEQVSETQVQFQAKDSQYRKTLDSNYVINEERTCTYKFHGGGFDSMTGNKAEVRMYLLNNGGIAVYSESGSSLTFTGKGSWSEDKANHSITVDVNGSKSTTNGYCSTPGKEGYRMAYSTGRASVEIFCPVASGVTWDMYEDTDFDGSAVLEMNGGDYTLTLTDKNFAILRRGSTKISTLNYEVDANGNYVIKDGKTTVIKDDFFNPEVEKSDTVSSREGNVITVIVTVGISNGPGVNYSDITFTGTVS